MSCYKYNVLTSIHLTFCTSLTIKVAYWNKIYDAFMAGECDVILDEDMHEYERVSTEHDARQPFIEEYSCVTYRQLSGHINHWCQHCCIEAWLKSHDTYSLYAKNIKPGLSAENQLEQVAFSRRVQQRWGLAPTQKIFWIHCDEKWFHGIVPRTTQCESVFRAGHLQDLTQRPP
jgi:hypothetical protein